MTEILENPYLYYSLNKTADGLGKIMQLVGF